MYLAPRDALVALIDQAFKVEFPDVPLVFDNQPFERSNQPPKFVEVEIEFHDGSQVSISADSKTRVHGCVVATYTCRRGLGSRQGLEVLGWFSGILKYKVVGKLQLAAPQPEPSDLIAGWYRTSLRVNFHYDA